MKKTPFSHDKGTGISVILVLSMIVFSLVIASTFVYTYGSSISNSTSSISNSTSSISNSTSPTANLTAEHESRNGTIASFPGSIDSDRRHMPL